MNPHTRMFHIADTISTMLSAFHTTEEKKAFMEGLNVAVTILKSEASSETKESVTWNSE